MEKWSCIQCDFRTKCFSCTWLSSHVLSTLLRELTHIHMHAMHDLSPLCLTFSHTRRQMNLVEARQEVWHGQRWKHAGIRASAWDPHFPLSLLQSLTFFFLSSLTPLSHLSLPCLLCAFAEIHRRTVQEPIEKIWFLWLLWWVSVSLSASERIWGFCFYPTFPSFLLYFFPCWVASSSSHQSSEHAAPLMALEGCKEYQVSFNFVILFMLYICFTAALLSIFPTIRFHLVSPYDQLMKDGGGGEGCEF